MVLKIFGAMGIAAASLFVLIVTMWALTELMSDSDDEGYYG